jgi:hypothetical protein
MNSSSTEPPIESELLDLDAIPFTKLRDLEGDELRRSTRHVVERTSLVRARYRSTESGAGERID